MKYTKEYWSKIPKEQRSKRASELAIIRWAKTSKADRIKHSQMMVKARKVIPRH